MPATPRTSRRRRAEAAHPPGARVRGQAGFDAAYREGTKLVDPAVVAFVRPAPPEEAGRGWRLGLSVSRKVGNAPVRSRVKRVLREAFRRERAGLSGAADLLLVARAGTAPATLADAQAALGRILQRWQRAEQRAASRPARGPAPARGDGPG